MQRIHALDIANAPTASQDMLHAVHKKIGMVPNMFKTMAHSPAVLQLYLGTGEALAGGVLSAALREQLALVTAGANQCDYCASAHTLIGKGTGLSATELAANLSGNSADAKVRAALAFGKAIVASQGRVSDADLAAVRAAGHGEAEVVEIIAVVSMNIFTNYFNHIAATVIDFPLVQTATLASAA